MSALSSPETSVSGWMYAADLSELDDGIPMTVDVDGVPICLVRRGARIFALLDICSHQDYPLSQGEVTATTLECCVHGATFDLVTGAALTPPASKPVPVFPVRLCEGEVYVLVTGSYRSEGSSRIREAQRARGVPAIPTVGCLTRLQRLARQLGLPVAALQFPQGESASSLGLPGDGTFDITGVTALRDGIPATVRVTVGDMEFDAVLRIDTPGEADYYRNGGILPYVLRQLLRQP